MVLQVEEGEVCLGEGVSLLTRGRAGLGRRCDTTALEQLGELVVGHDDVLAAAAQTVQEYLLAHDDLGQVVVQQVRIQLHHWLGVHPDGRVDDAHLVGREPLLQLLEQGVGQVDVVGAVLHVGCEFSRGEVLTAFAHSVDDFLALLPQFILNSQCLEAAAHSGGVLRPGHRQGVEPQLGLDTELPREDGTIEDGVVAEDGLVAVVQRLEEPAHVVTTVGIDGPIVHLDAHTDHLEQWAADVGFRCDLRQGIILVVVCLEVDCYDVHHSLSPLSRRAVRHAVYLICVS